MTHTLTLRELREAVENRMDAAGVVRELSPLNKLARASLSARMMFHIGDTADEARKIYDRMETQRRELVKRLGQPMKDDKGAVVPDQFFVPAEKDAEFQVEYDALLSETCALDVRPFSVSEFEKYEAALAAVGFNGNDMRALRFMIPMDEAKADENANGARPKAKAVKK